MRHARRLLVLFCVLALLAGAMLAPAAGGSTPAVLVPIDPLFGLVVLPAAPADDPTPLYGYVPAAPGPSRAPPALV